MQGATLDRAQALIDHAPEIAVAKVQRWVVRKAGRTSHRPFGTLLQEPAPHPLLDRIEGLQLG